jgi:hypothetical protein
MVIVVVIVRCWSSGGSIVIWIVILTVKPRIGIDTAGCIPLQLSYDSTMIVVVVVVDDIGTSVSADAVVVATTHRRRR